MLGDMGSRRKGLSISVFENPTVIRCPQSREPLRIFAQNLYFQKLESLTYILLLTVCVHLHSHFSAGLRKTIYSKTPSTDHFLLQPLICKQSFHHMLLLPLSLSIFCCHLKSHLFSLFIPLPDSCLICTVPAQ